MNSDQRRDALDPLVFCGLKKSPHDRKVCEHCDRTYERSFKIGEGSEEKVYKFCVECDWCGDTRSKFSKLLKQGWDLKEEIARTKRLSDSPKKEKRLAALEEMIDQHRINYKVALDSARGSVHKTREGARGSDGESPLITEEF